MSLPSFQGLLPKKAFAMAKSPAKTSAAKSENAVSKNSDSQPALNPHTPVQLKDSTTTTHLPLEFSSLSEISKAVETCTRCKLCEGRRMAVPGEGFVNAEVLFVGEGPGEKEDETGRPFVGNAGLLLQKMIEAMGSTRTQVFSTNIVKCHPPMNRAPEADEIAACATYLKEQIRLLKPKVMVALGNTAAHQLLGTTIPIAGLRGKVHIAKNSPKIVATFHPAFLLKNPGSKKDAWEDLKLVMKELDWKTPPAR
jgi:uracil-DNA glycosylase family 4